MINESELAYWVTHAHLTGIGTSRKNEIIVACYNNQIELSHFYDYPEQWDCIINLSEKEKSIIKHARQDVTKNAFLTEGVMNQGISIIPITSSEYPNTLKRNLKYNSPVLLYVKGDESLLNAESIAIVGSRNASPVSLEFTKSIAKLASEKGQVVVSGFAKGVDKQALDSALESGGRSIIVLPQGISTFKTGMKTYYQQINSGSVLVLSTFHPNAPWSVECAMARNATIYGLANSIYAAQSDSKGGTWAGVIDGLRKGRTVYVRKPNEAEVNANNQLIEKGAIPVNMSGEVFQPKEENSESIIEGEPQLFNDDDFH